MISIQKHILHRLLVWCGVCIFVTGGAQTTVGLGKEEATFNFRANWKYHQGDNPEWASPTFDDKAWDTVNMDNLKGVSFPLNGIYWFRQELQVPSTIRGKTMLLLVDQTGASEIFLNGKTVKKFGKVGDIKSEIPFNPQNEINYITLDSTKVQTIAIRFSANKILDQGFAYPELHLSLADMNSANEVVSNSRNGIAFNLITFGIFITISIFHLLLYLYYRRGISNLYYSILAALLSVLLIYPFLTKSTHNPLRATRI